jgi:hypothetical protein
MGAKAPILEMPLGKRHPCQGIGVSPNAMKWLTFRRVVLCNILSIIFIATLKH